MRRQHIDLAPAARAHGTVTLPGSKSISIRALLLAALCSGDDAGETRLTGVLRSDDTTVMIDALRALGVTIVEQEDTLLVRTAPTSPSASVSPSRSMFPRREADVFVGNSGLSIRTLTAALAFAGGRYRLSGIARMHERPIGDLVEALTAIGACIGYAGEPGFPPLVIEAAKPSSKTISVAAGTSSQFLTGLLQAAPMLARGGDAACDIVVTVEGDLISRPYVDLTIAMMKRFGVDVHEEPSRVFTIASGARYASPGAFAVEGDASSASYLLAAGPARWRSARHRRPGECEPAGRRALRRCGRRDGR